MDATSPIQSLRGVRKREHQYRGSQSKNAVFRRGGGGGGLTHQNMNNNRNEIYHPTVYSK